MTIANASTVHTSFSVSSPSVPGAGVVPRRAASEADGVWLDDGFGSVLPFGLDGDALWVVSSDLRGDDAGLAAALEDMVAGKNRREYVVDDGER